MEQNFLLEAIEGFGSKSIFEAEVMTSMKDKFVVSVYKRDNESDRQFIKDNKEEIINFFNKGYDNAKIGKFASCRDADAVKHNTVLLKVARTLDENSDIVAMAIYTKHPKGVKCVGITRLFTDDERLERIGSAAVKYMIKDDICHFSEFRWCECSGAIKHYFEKYTGDLMKIPNTYLPVIFKENQLLSIEPVPGNDYDYMRLIQGLDEPVKKCIFGFPSQEILDDYLAKRNKCIDDFREELTKNIVLEHMFTNVPGDIQNNLKIMGYFYEVITDEYAYEITEHEMEVFTDAIDTTREFYEKTYGRLSDYVREEISDALNQAMSDANLFTIIKPYEIGEDFILEQQRYVEKDELEYYE